MIDKNIHYIWLGKSKKPKSLEIALNSWIKYASDWNIKEWNEDNISEFKLPAIFFELLKYRKFAFASDVLRFYILNKYGGFYMDADQVLIRPIDELLDNDLVLSRYHSRQDYYGFGAIGASRNNILSQKLIEYFESDNSYTRMDEFIIINKLASQFVNEILKDLNSQEKILILEQESFHPEIENRYTDYTFAHHLSNTSWIPWWKRILYKLPFYGFFKKIIYTISPNALRKRIFKTKY